jgi:tetratricopeptide (TPR) repeat protein
MLLKETNRLAEAEPLMKRALTIFEQIYGPDHPNVATSLCNLASLLREGKRLAEAGPLMQRALAINEQTYGSFHPSVDTTLSQLAGLMLEAKRLAEAEPLMRRRLALLATHTRRTGHQHPQLNAAMENYVSLLLATGFEEMDIRKRLATLTGENGETQG